jgi:hypothetical protein
MSKNIFAIRSIFYNSLINRSRFITNKKKFNITAGEIKHKKNKQYNLSLLKRQFSTQKEKEKDKDKDKRTLFSSMAFAEGGGGGGGGSNIFIVCVSLLVAKISHDSSHQKY